MTRRPRPGVVSRAGGALGGEAGQTASEYLGLLLVCAAVVVAVVQSGVATAIGDGILRQVCAISAAGDCTQGQDPTVDREPAPGDQERRRPLAAPGTPEAGRAVAPIGQVPGVDSVPAVDRGGGGTTPVGFTDDVLDLSEDFNRELGPLKEPLDKGLDVAEDGVDVVKDTAEEAGKLVFDPGALADGISAFSAATPSARSTSSPTASAAPSRKGPRSLPRRPSKGSKGSSGEESRTGRSRHRFHVARSRLTTRSIMSMRTRSGTSSAIPATSWTTS